MGEKLKIHHLTHLQNLEKILKSGKLLSRNSLTSNNFFDTADENIIGKRNNINNSIPFHFNFIQEKYGISYNHTILNNFGFKNMIYFIYECDDLCNFCIDKCNLFLYHPISNFSRKVENIKIIIDEVENLPKNINNILNYNSKQVQNYFMSEAIFINEFPIIKINKIICYDEITKKIIELILIKNNFHNIKVVIDLKYFR